ARAFNLNSYDITSSTHAKPPYPQRLPTRASRLLVHDTRQAPWPNLLDLLAGGRRFDGRRFMEGFLKSRTSRLGSHHPDCEHLFSDQGRRPARLVAHPDVHPVGEFHHLDNSLHRCGKELRERNGVWSWFAFAAVHFLPDPRLWQCAISRPRSGRFPTAAGRLGVLRRRKSAVPGFVLASGPAAVGRTTRPNLAAASR